jgi:hypothetical protein
MVSAWKANVIGGLQLFNIYVFSYYFIIIFFSIHLLPFSTGFLNPAPGIKGSGNISPWIHPGLVCLENGTRSDKVVKSLPCMDQEVRGLTPHSHYIRCNPGWRSHSVGSLSRQTGHPFYTRSRGLRCLRIGYWNDAIMVWRDFVKEVLCLHLLKYLKESKLFFSARSSNGSYCKLWKSLQFELIFRISTLRKLCSISKWNLARVMACRLQRIL